MSNLNIGYLPAHTCPGLDLGRLDTSWRIWKNKSDASIGLWKLNTPREDFRYSFELQKSCLYTTAANSAITTTLGRGEGSWTRTKKNARF